MATVFESDMARVTDECKTQIERQQRLLTGLLEQRSLSHDSTPEVAVNAAVALEALRFTRSVLETQDLGCHLLNMFTPPPLG